MQRKDGENSGPFVSLQKARIVPNTAMMTVVIRSAFRRKSANQMLQLSVRKKHYSQIVIWAMFSK